MHRFEKRLDPVIIFVEPVLVLSVDKANEFGCCFLNGTFGENQIFFTENLLSLSVTQSCLAFSFSSSTWQVASDLREATLYFLTGVSVW